MATAAVLFIKPDIIATVRKKIKNENQGLLPAILYR